MRLPTIARNLSLAACTAAEDFREEPLQLLIQASRRLPERARTRIGATVGVGHPGPVRAAYAAWIVDRPEDARAQLRAARPLSRTGQRLFAELANQLDEPGLIPPSVMRGRLAARVARRRGDVVEPWTPPRASLPRSPSVRSSNEPISVFHLLTNSLPHTSSGYAHRSHAVLKAQRAAGLRVAAATRLGYPVIVGKLLASRHDVIDGIDYYRLVPCRRRTGLGAQVRQAADLLEPLVRSFGADILSTTTDYTNGLVASEVASRLGIPWTYEVRGLPEETWVVNKPPGHARDCASKSPHRNEARIREAYMALSANHVFAISQQLKRDFVQRGLAASRITVVPNFADPDVFAKTNRRSPQTPRKTRQSLGLPVDGFWVGTATSMVDYEGLDTLLDAMTLARRDGYDVRAYLMGAGRAQATLISAARQRGLADAVLFPGAVPREEAPEHLLALDAFAVPRQDERVCQIVPPLKVAEALACGTPVIASDLPVLREMLGGFSGLLVRAGDPDAWSQALISMMTHPPKVGIGRSIQVHQPADEVGSRYAATIATLSPQADEET